MSVCHAHNRHGSAIEHGGSEPAAPLKLFDGNGRAAATMTVDKQMRNQYLSIGHAIPFR